MDPLKKARLVFYASEIAAIGSWVIVLDTWSAALQPVKIGALLISVAGVAAAALGASILKPKE